MEDFDACIWPYDLLRNLVSTWSCGLTSLLKSRILRKDGLMTRPVPFILAVVYHTIGTERPGYHLLPVPWSHSLRSRLMAVKESPRPSMFLCSEGSIVPILFAHHFHQVPTYKYWHSCTHKTKPLTPTTDQVQIFPMLALVVIYNSKFPLPPSFNALFQDNLLPLLCTPLSVWYSFACFVTSFAFSIDPARKVHCKTPKV